VTALVLAYAIAPSLADPQGSSSLAAAVRWIEQVALGTIATSIAVIAVASIGLLMLTGRLQIRRGATVILGCFVLFGAPTIAAGILGAVRSGPQAAAPVVISRTVPPPPPLPLPTPKAAPSYDPYAGAAVPPR